MTATTQTGGPSRRGRRVMQTVLGAVMTGLLLLAAGCTGGTATSSRDAVAPLSTQDEMSSAGEAGVPGDVQQQPSATDGKAGTGGNVPDASGVALVPRDLVVTGSLTVRVKDVHEAASRSRSLATQLGGVVSNERVTGASDAETEDQPDLRGKGPGDPRPWPSAQLTLRVPTDRADEAMDRLVDLGTLVDRELTSQDVTAQVVDVASRVATARASVERVRALLEQAKTLGEVVQIESELTRRQADLESLEAQRKRLADLTDLATLTVTFIPTTAPIVTSIDDSGFLTGLRAGWKAFVAAAVAGLTVLGATLPFLGLAALVGIPVVLTLRRRARRGRTDPGHDGAPA